MSVFYDHLLNLEDLHQELSHLNLTTKEHFALLNLIDSTLHHEVISVCLDCLPIEHHETFLVQYKTAPNDPALLEQLKTHEPKIEERIHSKSSEVREKLKRNLHKYK